MNPLLERRDYAKQRTTLYRSGFVYDLEVRVPENVGVALSATAFFTDAKVFGESGEYFLTSLKRSSADYATQERKVYLEVTGFVVSPTIYQYEENQI